MTLFRKIDMQTLQSILGCIFIGIFVFQTPENPLKFKVAGQKIDLNFSKNRRVNPQKNMVRIFYAIFVFSRSENLFILNFKVKEQIWKFHKNGRVDPQVNVVALLAPDSCSADVETPREWFLDIFIVEGKNRVFFEQTRSASGVHLFFWIVRRMKNLAWQNFSCQSAIYLEWDQKP